jgi:hypothetical protein
MDDLGSSDHPLFIRMPNTRIDSCETSRFGQYKFRDAAGATIPVEGRLYKISYCIKRGEEPPGELQIIRNHTNAMRNIGGTVLFEDKANAFFGVKKGGTETRARLHPWNRGDCYTPAIVERQAMAQDVLADAGQMAADIGNSGKIALYGICFDTDGTGGFDRNRTEEGRAKNRRVELVER